MSVEGGEHTAGLRRELRILSYVLLAYGIYAIANGLYSIIADHVWPRLFEDPSYPLAALPWPYALLTVFTTALTVTLAGLAYRWVKAGQSRGWWLGGALFTHMIIGSCVGIAQMTLMRVPPDNLPLYTVSPGVLAQSLAYLVLGLIILVYLCRATTMKALAVGTVNKAGKVARLFLYGFLLMLMHFALVALITWIIAVFPG